MSSTFRFYEVGVRNGEDTLAGKCIFCGRNFRHLRAIWSRADENESYCSIACVRKAYATLAESQPIKLLFL